MAAFHNQLETIYQKEYQCLYQEGHIKQYHVNDYGGGYLDRSNLKTLPIGKGKIDFERFFSFIHSIGYHDTFTIEATAFDQSGQTHIDLLNSCFDYIHTHLDSHV